MRRLVGVVAVIGMLALSGCGGGEPLPTLPPTSSAAPVFASEEEALVAAVAAYVAYRQASDEIAADGGSSPERIVPFVTERRLDDEYRGFATLREEQLRIVGGSSVEVIELQRLDQTATSAEVVFYACSDISASRVIDASGADVTPASRPDRFVLEIVMVTTNPTGDLVLESDDPWPGQSC